MVQFVGYCFSLGGPKVCWTALLPDLGPQSHLAAGSENTSTTLAIHLFFVPFFYLVFASIVYFPFNVSKAYSSIQTGKLFSFSFKNK